MSNKKTLLFDSNIKYLTGSITTTIKLFLSTQQHYHDKTKSQQKQEKATDIQDAHLVGNRIEKENCRS